MIDCEGSEELEELREENEVEWLKLILREI